MLNPVASELRASYAAGRARIEAPRILVRKPKPRPYSPSPIAMFAIHGLMAPPPRRESSAGPDANAHVAAYKCRAVGLDPKQYQRPSVNQVIGVVSRVSGISIADIKSDKRKATIMLPRQIAMYLAAFVYKHSLPSTGRWFGDRDHTTVLHGSRKIARIIDQPDVATIVNFAMLALPSPPSDEEPVDMAHNPEGFRITVESARLALLKAGPHSGLHGAAAACMDKQLAELRDWLGEVAENRRLRLNRESSSRETAART